jgi:hypothetical protein
VVVFVAFGEEKDRLPWESVHTRALAAPANRSKEGLVFKGSPEHTVSSARAVAVFSDKNLELQERGLALKEDNMGTVN